MGVFTDKGVVLEMQHKKMSFVATTIEFTLVKEEEVSIGR